MFSSSSSGKKRVRSQLHKILEMESTCTSIINTSNTTFLIWNLRNLWISLISNLASINLQTLSKLWDSRVSGEINLRATGQVREHSAHKATLEEASLHSLVRIYLNRSNSTTSVIEMQSSTHIKPQRYRRNNKIQLKRISTINNSSSNRDLHAHVVTTTISLSQKIFIRMWDNQMQQMHLSIPT